MSTLPPIPSIVLRTMLLASGVLAATACSDPPPEIAGSTETGDPSTSTGPGLPSSSSGSHDSTATESNGTAGSTGSGSTDGGTTSAGSSSGGSTDSGTTRVGSSSGGSTDSGTTRVGSSSGGSSDSGTTDGGTTDGGSSDSGSTGGGGTGFCGQVCADATDCVPPGGSPADWACTDGTCEHVGVNPPCDPLTCPLAAGLTCADVDGMSVCVMPCTSGGNECDILDFECTGVTDLGDTFCQPTPCGGAAEGAPCFIMGFGQYGTCTDGLCTCTDDSECTAAGYACTV